MQPVSRMSGKDSWLGIMRAFAPGTYWVQANKPDEWLPAHDWQTEYIRLYMENKSKDSSVPIGKTIKEFKDTIIWQNDYSIAIDFDHKGSRYRMSAGDPDTRHIVGEGYGLYIMNRDSRMVREIRSARTLMQIGNKHGGAQRLRQQTCDRCYKPKKNNKHAPKANR